MRMVGASWRQLSLRPCRGRGPRPAADTLPARSRMAFLGRPTSTAGSSPCAAGTSRTRRTVATCTERPLVAARSCTFSATTRHGPGSSYRRVEACGAAAATCTENDPSGCGVNASPSVRVAEAGMVRWPNAGRKGPDGHRSGRGCRTHGPGPGSARPDPTRPDPARTCLAAPAPAPGMPLGDRPSTPASLTCVRPALLLSRSCRRRAGARPGRRVPRCAGAGWGADGGLRGSAGLSRWRSPTRIMSTMVDADLMST